MCARVISLLGPSYGIAKEKGDKHIGRDPLTSLCENKEDLSERLSDDAPTAGKTNNATRGMPLRLVRTRKSNSGQVFLPAPYSRSHAYCF